jgi:hypothetical protein
MTTTTPTTATPTETIGTLVSHWVTLIKAHEKLLVIVLASLVALHYGDRAYSAYGAYLANKANADKAAVAALAQQNAQTAATLAALQTTIKAQAKIEDIKIQTAIAQMKAQQKKDQTLPLPDLDHRWQVLVGAKDGDIVAEASGNTAVNDSAARSTVTQLEEVPALRTELTSTQTKLDGCEQVRTADEAQLTGTKTELAAEQKSHQADLKQAAHDRRASFWRGFKWGAVAGFVGGVVTLHKL